MTNSALRTVATACAALALSAVVPRASEAYGGGLRMASTPPTFQISTFAQGSSTLYNPDGIVVTKTNVYVVYQNNSDHVNGVPSVVVEYDRMGNMVGSVSLIGRCDGLRQDPRTQLLWALLNNDGLNGKPKRQPKLFTIDPATLKATQYFFPKVQPHGGGYDDIAFFGGKAFVSASSETLGPGGINDKPAVVQVILKGNQAEIKPVVYGNTYGYNINTKQFQQLNITDPDSMMVDTQGNVVLDSQGDAQLIFIRHPGTKTQSVARLGVGTQLDDSAWTTGTSGTLFVADAALNVVYSIAATFPSGTVFSEAPQGSTVSSFLGTLDTKTGILTPVLTELQGIVNPTSLVFVPAGS